MLYAQAFRLCDRANFPSPRTCRAGACNDQPPPTCLSSACTYLLQICVHCQKMQAHPHHFDPQTEHGLDGWHVWGPQENLLFYSKDPVVKVPTSTGGHNTNTGSDAQDEEINIKNVSHNSWTDLMKSAHQEVLRLFSASLAAVQP